MNENILRRYIKEILNEHPAAAIAAAVTQQRRAAARKASGSSKPPSGFSPYSRESRNSNSLSAKPNPHAWKDSGMHKDYVYRTLAQEREDLKKAHVTGANNFLKTLASSYYTFVEDNWEAGNYNYSPWKEYLYHAVEEQIEDDKRKHGKSHYINPIKKSGNQYVIDKEIVQPDKITQDTMDKVKETCMYQEKSARERIRRFRHKGS